MSDIQVPHRAPEGRTVVISLSVEGSVTRIAIGTDFVHHHLMVSVICYENVTTMCLTLKYCIADRM